MTKKADTRKVHSKYPNSSNEYTKVYLPREGDTPPRVVEEARLKMEKKLGRKLKYNEVVHHESEKKGDSSDDNLEVISRQENTRKHYKKKK